MKVELTVQLNNVPGRMTPIPVGTEATVDRMLNDGSVVVWIDEVRFPVTLQADEYKVTCSTCRDTGFNGDGCPTCGRY